MDQESVVLETTLTGWACLQMSRLLGEETVADRFLLVRRYANLAGPEFDQVPPLLGIRAGEVLVLAGVQGDLWV